MISRNFKLFLNKIFSFFSVIRVYNILVIILAQYLSAIFILAPEKRALNIILDWRLLILVLATALAIASGYIINNFYDAKKDLINRPKKLMIDRVVSQKTQLQVYFFLNFCSALLGLIISWRAALFFSIYIFSIWFYSHKLKKFAFIGNLSAALLAVLPFFAVLLYFKNFYEVVFFHACFLYLIILIREIIKDLENLQGDLLNNYQTIPVVLGEKKAKKYILFLLLLTLVPVYFLIRVFDVGFMDTYFYISYVFLFFFIINLFKANQKGNYIKLHFLLKIILLMGVICIVLIKPNVVENAQKLLLYK